MTPRPVSTTLNKQILLGIMGAACLGAVLMALVTPKTGKEVRGVLKTAGKRLWEGLDAEVLEDGPPQAMFV